MGIYRRFILPRLIDRSMERPVLHEPRRMALASASGRVLELGFGGGANLGCYPAEVAVVEAIEPLPRLTSAVLRRIAESGREVHFRDGRAEALPFAAGTFDTVVSSFTLCSVDDPQQAMAEVRRVLRPGGRFLFLEHGLAPDARVARWQRRLEPFQRHLAGGCHLTRDMDSLVRQAGFSRYESRSGYLAGLPRLSGYLSQGQAVAACSQQGS